MRRSIKDRIKIEPHIVEVHKIGNTTVRVADNYCRDMTKEDVQKVLDRISDKVSGWIAEQEYKDKMAAQK